MMRRATKGEKVFITADVIFLFVFLFIILIPLFSVLTSSFIGAEEIARRGQFILFPEKIDLTSYRILLQSNSTIWRAYKNTFFVVFVGTACNMIVTVMMAYPLSKKNLKGRNFVLSMVFFTMLFNGGMVANYMWVKQLNLINNRWVLILPGLVNAWNMLLMRNFFYSVPESLEEAAFLDGAGQLQVLIRIVLPLSIPSIATISLFYAVAHWNAWFGGVMYITRSELLPVQNILRTIVTEATAMLQEGDLANMDDVTQMPAAQTVKSAAIVVSTLPILFAYPFIQKYFVKGVMVGSVKG